MDEAATLAAAPGEPEREFSKMKPAAFTALVWTVSLWMGTFAGAAERARIADIRVGRHASFDRLVFEFERDVEVSRLPDAEDGAFQLEFNARPLLPHQQIETSFKRIGTIVIEAVPAGTRLRVEARPRRVRVFLVGEPTRIVVDFGDPGPEPFPAPEGTQSVPERVRPPPEEPLAVVKEVPTEPTPSEPELAPTPAEEPAPEPEAPAPTLAEAPEPEAPAPTRAEALEVEVAPVPIPQPEAPSPVPEPELPARVSDPEAPAAPVAVVETPPQVPEVVEAAPAPGPAERAWFERLDLRHVIGAAVLIMGLAFIALVRSRRSRPRRERAGSETPAPGWPRAPETIKPAEIADAGEQVDLMDRRIDEEVRARMHLEERLAQVQEELKVMRDRLQRVTRRGERPE